MPFQVVCHLGDKRAGLHDRVVMPDLDSALQALQELLDDYVQPQLQRQVMPPDEWVMGYVGIGPSGGLKWRKAIYLHFKGDGTAVLHKDRDGKQTIARGVEEDLLSTIRRWALTAW
ncbi:hypothetical protein [Miltoncostaea marina]|uniref:hypothetical protein n=1 Tax=Miltoncostaea marina TaxID=2843215 RepID=UPI001C3DAF2D|nr:hypothetical protein [Miltoncostaea marina]